MVECTVDQRYSPAKDRCMKCANDKYQPATSHREVVCLSQPTCADGEFLFRTGKGQQGQCYSVQAGYAFVSNPENANLLMQTGSIDMVMIEGCSAECKTRMFNQVLHQMLPTGGNGNSIGAMSKEEMSNIPRMIEEMRKDTRQTIAAMGEPNGDWNQAQIASDSLLWEGFQLDNSKRYNGMKWPMARNDTMVLNAEDEEHTVAEQEAQQIAFFLDIDERSRDMDDFMLCVAVYPADVAKGVFAERKRNESRVLTPVISIQLWSGANSSATIEKFISLLFNNATFVDLNTTSTAQPSTTGAKQRREKDDEEELVPTCAWWHYNDESKQQQNDPNAEVEDGYWDTSGCETILGEVDETTNEPVVRCNCTHLTHFAVILSPRESNSDGFVTLSPVQAKHERALEILTFLGLTVSIVALLCILGIYGGNPHLIEQKEKLLLSLVFTLFLQQFVFVFMDGVLHTTSSAKETCKAVAVLEHYLILAVWGWMICEGYHLRDVFLKVVGFDDKQMKYTAFSLGVPVLLVGLSFGIWNDDYGSDLEGEYSVCWIKKESPAMWFVYIPVFLGLAFNMVTLAQLVFTLHKQLSESGMAKAAFVFSISLGMNYLFGFMILVDPTEMAWQYLFTIFTGLQGICLLYWRCLRNPKVRRHLYHQLRESFSSNRLSWSERLQQKGKGNKSAGHSMATDKTSQMHSIATHVSQHDNEFTEESTMGRTEVESSLQRVVTKRLSEDELDFDIEQQVITYQVDEDHVDKNLDEPAYERADDDTATVLNYPEPRLSGPMYDSATLEGLDTTDDDISKQYLETEGATYVLATKEKKQVSPAPPEFAEDDIQDFPGN
eukprot:m.64454 g.64454  ORF g.64454 m.64454 type:complete len:834 (-) comp11651_c0_seq1:23-2524(-)